MSSLRAQVQVRLLMPSLTEVDPAVRGFAAWEDGASIVSTVGAAFLDGYRTGLTSRRAVDAVRALQSTDDYRRGFAMEGLGMAMGVRDALRPGARHFRELLGAAGERHGYMLYVGLGWAMARTPRRRWPALESLDPLLAALALDGYGFHETFFRTRRVWDERGVGFDASAWPGPPETAHEHLLQGVGRALWFVAGGSPARLRQYVAEFPAADASSLWAGVGLAAGYAGGRDETALAELLEAAGDDVAWLRQGASFAVEARDRASTVVAHTVLAARTLCGRQLEDVVALVRRTRPTAASVDAGDWSAYERWRTDIAAEYRASHDVAAGQAR